MCFPRRNSNDQIQGERFEAVDSNNLCTMLAHRQWSMTTAFEHRFSMVTGSFVLGGFRLVRQASTTQVEAASAASSNILTFAIRA